MDKSKDWTLLNPTWRMFYVMFDRIEPSQLAYKLSDTDTVFTRVGAILKALLQNSAAKNFSVKHLLLTQLIQVYVQKSL